MTILWLYLNPPRWPIRAPMNDAYPPGISAAERLLCDQRIDDEVSKYGHVRPPWLYLPGESPYSIAWRMGGGEGHVVLFHAWAVRADLDEAARIALVVGWQAPPDWLPWCASFIWNLELDDDDDERAAVARLEGICIGTVASWEAAMAAEIVNE